MLTVFDVDNNIAKMKLMRYLQDAESMDRMVLICEKFLEKYKENDSIKKPDVIVAENTYSTSYILQMYSQEEQKKTYYAISG